MIGLRVEGQHLCVGTESGWGFSSGYILLSFQNLTHKTASPKLGFLLETGQCLLCVETLKTQGETKENPPFKGGWQKIDLARRGGMNQNTPTSDGPIQYPPTHWMGWEAPPECEPADYEWYWTLRSGFRQGKEVERSCLLRRAQDKGSGRDWRVPVFRHQREQYRAYAKCHFHTSEIDLRVLLWGCLA